MDIAGTFSSIVACFPDASACFGAGVEIDVNDVEFASKHRGSDEASMLMEVTVSIGCPAVQKVNMTVVSGREQRCGIINWVVKFIATGKLLPL